MKHIGLILLFLFLCIRSAGQISVDTCAYVCFNEFTKSKINIRSVKITNTTKEDYITWISYDYTNLISNEEAIHRYFGKQIGDFSLSFLLYENLLNSSLTNRIGTTFMKRIKPGETFEYLIIKKNIHIDFYERRIILIPLIEIEQYLQKTIPEECFFPFNTLPLGGHIDR
jgi:hypothetical protein